MFTDKRQKKMCETVLGIVVFGAGTAGRVRIRDTMATNEGNCAWKLQGYVSR